MPKEGRGRRMPCKSKKATSEVCVLGFAPHHRVSQHKPGLSVVGTEPFGESLKDTWRQPHTPTRVSYLIETRI